MPSYFLCSMTVFRTILTLVRYTGDTWRSQSQEIACFDNYKSMRDAITKINRVRVVPTICTVEFTLETKHNALWEQGSRQSSGCNIVTDFIFWWPCILLHILANNQLDALFHVFIYFVSPHVSSVTALIIRRSNCMNTSSGMISLCKWLLGMPASWPAYQAVTYTD